VSHSDICIVSMENVKRVPYIGQYVKCLGGKDFDFLYWDRDCTNDQVGQKNSFPYCHKVRHGEPTLAQKAEKLTGYIGFKYFASKILKKNGYKRVVCLTGNAAVLVSDVLLGNYSGRFIIDIRDYWHEDNKKYHDIEQRLIEACPCPVISSPAYKEFLGEHDFRIMHNSQILSDEEKKVVEHGHERPFRIVCAGAAKNLDYDKRVIDCFANDERFILAFRGRGYNQLCGYIEERGIMNVEATGEFDFSQTLRQYADADMVLSMYGNGSPYWDYALANKLYFAAQLGLPILVCEKTAMADMTERYELGVAFDPADKAAKDRIARLFDEDQVSKRREGCCEFLERVEADNERALFDIKDFFDC
jgi:glycosyltransferase involved in cell wall biosynthesis